MTGSLTLNPGVYCGASDSPGKETLIYTIIFGITENKSNSSFLCLKVTLIPCEFMIVNVIFYLSLL